MPLPHQSNTPPKSFDLKGHKALIITTSQKTLDTIDAETGAVIKTGQPTGVYAAEMTEPYYTFLDAGMTVDLCSIKGGEIPIDPLSLRPLIRTNYDVRFMKDATLKKKAANSLPIEQINPAGYDIIFLAGGWGAAYDFAQSNILAEKISTAYAKDKVLSAVCHGPLGFVNAKKPDGTPLVEGVHLTGVTNKQLKQLFVTGTPKHPETELRRMYAQYESKSGLVDMFNTCVVTDRHHRMVTGQNQKAGVEVAQKAIELLLSKSHKEEQLSFRLANQHDLKALQHLFTETITSVCQNDYTPEQIKAWTSSTENAGRWHDMLHDQYVLIAEEDDQIVGFASLAGKDYLDFFYVHKDYQGLGIAKQLYHKIEEHARSEKASTLSSDISITAKPFFESRGFVTIKKQENHVRGAVLVNYKMMKKLSD